MKTWKQLMIRHGWLLKENEMGEFDCTMETETNLAFLFGVLRQARVEYIFGKGTLFIEDEPLLEEQWIQLLDFEHRGIGEGLWFRPGVDQPKIKELDTYICGVVRQLNRLGFYTVGSCDGHGRKAPYVMVTKDRDITALLETLKLLGYKRVRSREKSNSYHIAFHMSRAQLLELAEKLSSIEEDWLGEGAHFVKQRLFFDLLHQLLLIPGVSGDEGRVRDFVVEKLTPYVDHVSVDYEGNILTEKTYRGGNGPVILLNAHLDTVFEFEPERKIIRDGNIWSSSKGILGADDRAGVAVLLHLAEHLQYSSFSGKVKFIFTVEEECGLIGAQQVNDDFLRGVVAAIVVDRRGKGDIVTSCGGYIPFCDERYGAFFEQVALEENLSGWKTTAGGSSDTRIWAEHGIQSVNLSVGYGNEHTEGEFLDVEVCYQTTKLLKGVFQKSKELRAVLLGIRREGEIKGIC